nr:hypothetical protein [Tanacetum cinerariifolium]
MAGVDIRTLTVEQYLALSGGNQALGVVKPEIEGNMNFEIKIQFMRELREDTFSKNKNKDAYDHIDQVLGIVGYEIYKGPHIEKDCPLNEEVKQVEEVNFGDYGRRPHFNNGAKFHVGRYSQWQSSFLRYIDTKPNGDALRKCILEASKEDSDLEQAQRDKVIQKNLVLLGKKQKQAKDYNYHKEKMLCKQAEKGVPLQAEQAESLKDTNENLMNKNCDDECVALANLIAKFKLDTDENKKIQKQLKKDIATLTKQLEECKSTIEETISSRDRCKAKRITFKPITVRRLKKWLQLLHMDLCGPMRVESFNGKKYILLNTSVPDRGLSALFALAGKKKRKALKDDQ